MEITNDVSLTNAGLILLWPFLTTYFERLGMVEDENFVDQESQNRALYLLQNLVYTQIDSPEYALPLNKILVGMRVDNPVHPIESITQEEIELSESLLEGFRGNWSKMQNSSIIAVQESFLQRDGLISLVDEGYILVVDPKTIDILMQEIPYNLSLIQLPWMEKPLFVKWL